MPVVPASNFNLANYLMMNGWHQEEKEKEYTENHGNMEQQEGITDDMIHNWINTDKYLREALAEIHAVYSSEQEQTEMAFHKISEMYGLPKNPEDMQYDEEEEEDYELDNNYDPMPVYRELGLIKYLDPDGDLLLQVVTAIYFVKNKYNVDPEAAYQKYQELNPEKNCTGIGYIGDNSAVEIIFLDGSKSWLELGCKFYERTV